MNAINKEPEHQEIEALLPWYAAGTLSRRDANRVEQALAGDRELARQYDLVREELVVTIHLNETLGAPSARAMERLFAAIEGWIPQDRLSVSSLPAPSSHKAISVIQEALKEHDIDQIWKTHGIR